MTRTEKMNEVLKFIESKTKTKPVIGLILGSGLGVLADEITQAVKPRWADAKKLSNWWRSFLRSRTGI